MSAIHNLFETLKVNFLVYENNKAVFDEAFTHRSAVGEGHEKLNNERLEFLGDAVLELVTTEFLFKSYDKPEGELTNYRSALVKKENLAQVARKLQLGDLINMSKGEERSGGRDKDYLLANTLEALIGALYLSLGQEKTAEVIKTFVMIELDSILQAGNHIDAKSAFQEFTQGQFGITPEYKVLTETGKDHEKEFEIGAYLEQICVGKGKGGSKKEAQTAAAAEALESKKEWRNNFSLKV